ncbi:hypothetical protein [Streptomyces djakartensis]|uniref:Uncharacterized protein n=1 Tax=Streptomyces djakartensis TaxID=68193 RepID=A0ABQ2ZCW4_9ACTN|nr:hypothetical protein [Streptomyces djakartensis]GGY12805.1 hypothetical protein GCM10010384_17810 [Streptomyces djakartensis]
MAQRLRTAVHLVDPRTHDSVVLLPGDEPDEVLAELITHPDAWELSEPSSSDPSFVDEVERPPTVGTGVGEPEPEPARSPRRRTSKKTEAD